MERKDFLHAACKAGICLCTGMPLFSMSSGEIKTDDKKKEENDSRIAFMQHRFARLWDIMNSYVPQEERKKIINELGRECAAQNADYFKKYKKNPDVFLEELKKVWIDKVEFNKENKILRTYAKPTGQCGCPFVDKSKITKEFCNCSVGYTTAMYEIIFDTPVEVKLLESVLYGSQRCGFEIKFG